MKVWDYQNRACVQTLDGHTQNVSVVCFHPELPLILTGSEDGNDLPPQEKRIALITPKPFDFNKGTVRLWHANTYRLENTLNYGMERVWTVCTLRGSNDVGIGYDEGAIVIKVFPIHSFDG